MTVQNVHEAARWLRVNVSVLCTFVVAGCATVTVHDSEWCASPGDGASCFHTLNPASRGLTAGQWATESVGMVCTDPAVFADWKAAIEKLCSVSGLCRYDTTLVKSTKGP